MFITCYCTVINFMWNAQDIYINVKMWKSLERAKDKVWNLNGGSKKRGSSSISIE